MLPTPLSKSNPGRGHTQPIPGAPAGTSPANEDGSLVPGKYYHIIFQPNPKTQLNHERLVLCTRISLGEFAFSTLADKFNSLMEISEEEFTPFISMTILATLPLVKEIDPKDFPLYVGWAHVSSMLADLIKNL